MNKLEDISAFMDGESGQPVEAVVDSIQSDAELRGVWRRYHLIGDSLRSQLPSRFPATDLTSRISQALDNEPTVLSPRQQRQAVTRRLLKPAAGMAIAASVALVAIVGLRSLDQVTGTAGTAGTGASVAAQQAAPATTVATAGGQDEQPQQSLQPAQISPLARTVSTDGGAVTGDYQQSEGQYRFNSYLINHNEYRANAGVGGTMPYARIVAPHGNKQ